VKNAQGLRGFPTPDEAADDGYLVFRLPRENDWAGLLLGAAEALTSYYNFYESGDLSPEDAADRWRVIVQEAPYNLFDDPTSVPTPYWDEDTDVEDELPVETQTWYGYVNDPSASPEALTFVESSAIWAFTGFLAIATWEIGAAPAIAFNTIAPKFVLAVRRGNLGEIIRILVDGQDATTVDTSTYTEGDVIRTNIIGDPEFETHNIMLIQVS